MLYEADVLFVVEYFAAWIRNWLRTGYIGDRRTFCRVLCFWKQASIDRRGRGRIDTSALGVFDAETRWQSAEYGTVRASLSTSIANQRRS